MGNSGTRGDGTVLGGPAPRLPPQIRVARLRVAGADAILSNGPYAVQLYQRGNGVRPGSDQRVVHRDMTSPGADPSPGAERSSTSWPGPIPARKTQPRATDSDRSACGNQSVNDIMSAADRAWRGRPAGRACRS